MFNNNNKSIKALMKKYHVHEYEVANYLGRSYGNLIAKLRKPLTLSQRKRVIKAIKILSKKVGDK